MKIVVLKSDHVDLAQALFLYFQKDDGIENPISAPDEYIEKLLGKDDFHVIVALKGETVIGGLTAYELPGYKDEQPEMFLFEMGVKEEHRRKGVGTAIIEKLKEICLNKGISEMFVDAFADNSPACGLYESTGGKGENVVEFTYEIEK